VKQLTVAKLRDLARALELPLDDEELARLKPMVDDLRAVAQRLRHYRVHIGAGQDLAPARTHRPSE
jgi:hypothetical protein